MDEPGPDGGGLLIAGQIERPRPALTLRDEASDDGALLRQLFETGLGAFLRDCGLPPATVDQLISQQLIARERGHSWAHPHAQRQIVLADGRPVGRLSVDRAGDPWHVVDLAVLPRSRRRGIATALLSRLQADAGTAGVAIELYVATENPARNLYERTGFVAMATEGPDLRMRWAPT
jgi:ribosomal protein S18 acetylase RimI-like enzyme